MSRHDARTILAFLLSVETIPSPKKWEDFEPLDLNRFLRLIPEGEKRPIRRKPEKGESYDSGELVGTRLLSAIRQHRGWWVMLIRRSALDEEHNDFTDVETDEIRRVNRGASEAIPKTVHLCIRKEPIEGAYPMLLERREGLSRSEVLPFIQTLMRENSQLRYETPSGGSQKVWPQLNAQSRVRGSLLESLATGRLLNMEVVRTNFVNSGWGERGKTVESRSGVEIQVIRPDEGVSILKRIVGQAKEQNFAKVRLEFVPAGSDTPIPAVIDLSKEEVFDVSYGERHNLYNFDPPLKMCEEEIRMDLVDAMLDTWTDD